MDMTNAQQQIDALIGGQKFGQLAELCLSLLSVGKAHMEPDDYYRLSLIAGYALFEERRFRESFELVAPLHGAARYPVDTLYILTADSLLLENHEDALLYGDEFFAAVDAMPEKPEFPVLTSALKNVHDICNNLGSAAMKRGDADKAEAYFKKGIGYNRRSSLLYENLAVVYAQEGKWDKVRSTAEDGLAHCPDSPGVRRILGMALRNLRKYGDAMRVLTEAVEAGSETAMAELGFLCQSMSKFREAADWLKRFLDVEPGNQDVKKLYRNIIESPFYERPEPTISAALIVRDEEELIGQCLESIRDAVDEIVVVDTGSKDRTVEIAAGYTDTIFHHPWQDSFSEARNYSISKATGDWILIIDADEVLDEKHILKVREFKWSEDHDCFCLAVYSQLPGHLGGVNRGKHYSPRMFRRRGDIFYEGIVHNILRMPKKTAMTDIGIFHFGYDLRQDKMNRKYHRSLNLLLKQIEDDPVDPFVRYNTAQMYLSRGYFKEAKEHAEKIMEILTPDNDDQIHIYLMGLHQLILIHMRIGDFQSAEEYGRKALEVKPNYIDPMLALGWLYFSAGRLQEAENMLDLFIKTCNDLKEDNDFNMVILNKLGSEFEAYYILGEIYLKRGRPDDATLLLNKAVELNPYFWQSYKSLGRIAREKGEFDVAETLLERAIKLGYLNAEKYGTTGATNEVFTELLNEYKEIQFKLIDTSRDKSSIDEAIRSIDDFLSRK